MTSRWIYALIAATCAALLSYALYTQYFDGLHPCPLCMTQRAFFVLAGLTALVTALIHPNGKGRNIASGLIVLFCGGGGAVAARQVWLQSLPADQVPACGPSLEYMFSNLPFSEAFQTLMMGDGNCAEIVWTLFGLSMPNWALIAYIGLGLAAIVAALPWVKR
ncbi:disulfide bond formation protein DsbB [Spongiibacter sp. IMCC21906]|uniref:disulfide bond formation protein B n=1 Tax=Spongiibacter sp. IMCC21906 TaxID=1620392 RepID=UPI00062DDD55|nr:disulfide bond formation protein B [Spongiibacter sp. IMCC21906]AKH68254.1 disulfide bond formation protein DsbB [Spongiibacter sp. IMCC21906]